MENKRKIPNPADISEVIKSLQQLHRCISDIFGPGLEKVIITNNKGEVIVTKDGSSIFKSVSIFHPLSRMIINACCKHHSQCGNSAKSCFLLTFAAFSSWCSQTTNQYHVCSSIITKQRYKMIQSVKWFINVILLSKGFKNYLFEHLALTINFKDDFVKFKTIAACIIKGGLVGKFSTEAIDVLVTLLLGLLKNCNSISTFASAVLKMKQNFDFIVHEIPGVILSHSAVFNGIFINKKFPKVLLNNNLDHLKAVVADFDDGLLPCSDFRVKLSCDSNLSAIISTKYLMNWLQICIKLNITVIWFQGSALETFRSLCEENNIGLIDCLLREDICFISSVLNISPIHDILDEIALNQISTIALKEVQVGNCTFINVLPSIQNLNVFSLTVCSPSPNLCSQYKASLYNSLIALQHWLYGCVDILPEMINIPKCSIVRGGGLFFISLQKLLSKFDLVKSIVNELEWLHDEIEMFNIVYSVLSEMLLIVPQVLHKNIYSVKDKNSRFIHYLHALDIHCCAFSYSDINEHSLVGSDIVEPLHCQLTVLHNALNIFVQVLGIDSIVGNASIIK